MVCKHEKRMVFLMVEIGNMGKSKDYKQNIVLYCGFIIKIKNAWNEKILV